MHVDDRFRLGKPIVARCMYHACEEHDKPYVIEVPAVELKPE